MVLLDDLYVLLCSSSLRKETLVLDLLGWISFTTLLITVSLSDKIHRHSVFINFLCTWVMYSSFKTFACVFFLEYEV